MVRRFFSCSLLKFPPSILMPKKFHFKASKNHKSFSFIDFSFSDNCLTSYIPQHWDVNEAQSQGFLKVNFFLFLLFRYRWLIFSLFESLFTDSFAALHNVELFYVVIAISKKSKNFNLCMRSCAKKWGIGRNFNEISEKKFFVQKKNKNKKFLN